jgi:hypothetical protein
LPEFSFLDFAVLALATARLARMLTGERGIYGAFARLRRLFGIEHDEDGEPVSWPDTEAGRLLRCPLCCSVWVGAGMVGLYLWAPGITVIVALPLALSAVAVTWGEWVDGQSEH